MTVAWYKISRLQQMLFFFTNLLQQDKYCKGIQDKSHMVEEKKSLGLVFDRGCKFDKMDLDTWTQILFISSTCHESSIGDHCLKLFFSGKVFKTGQYCNYSFKGSVTCVQN